MFNINYLAMHKMQMHAGTISKLLYGLASVWAIIHSLSNSNTMGCPPVRGAKASGLSCVQVDKHGRTILYHLHR